MLTPLWKGIYPAVTTKFTPDGKIDQHAFVKGLHFQLEAGVNGIILAGSLGENSTLTRDERIELLMLARDAVGGKVPVLLNVAEGSTKQAIALAQSAEENGAAGLMVLPPMMYKATPHEVVRFFSDIATETALPILVYNNPVDYKIEVTPEMFEQLLKHTNIQAVKESTRDLANVTRLINRFEDRLSVLTGVDTIATEAMIMGATGWVAGLVNAFPRETVTIYKLIQQGRIAEARVWHRWFMPLLELDISPQLVQYIKLAERIAGTGTEYVRPPRLLPEVHERAELETMIREVMGQRPAFPVDL